MLLRQYERTENAEQLEDAISRAELVCSTTPKDHPNLIAVFNNLGLMLARRYERFGNIDDLDKAIPTAELTVSTAPDDHLALAVTLENLGDWLMGRYEHSEKTEDMDMALCCFISCNERPHEVPLIRVRAARKAIRILQHCNDFDQASSLAQTAIELLPNLCGRYFNREDQQYAIL
jgi:tetratricopeptide (TPR) repeat protein